MHTLIDTHCHLDLAQFNDDRANVINNAYARGVRSIVVPAIDLTSCSQVIELAARHENVYAAVGIHPNDIPTIDSLESVIERLRMFAAHPKVIAIGEIGLDYYWNKVQPSIQKTWLRAQLRLATETNLPVIVHNRDSTSDILAVLQDWADSPAAKASPWSPGVLHSFSGTWGDAEKALAMGFYLGFTGPLTYKNAEVMRDVAFRVPTDLMVIETDAPFLSPHPHRGARNEPAFVEIVAAKLSEIRKTCMKEISEQTTQNAHALFRGRLA